jgi:hypothetical protein
LANGSGNSGSSLIIASSNQGLSVEKTPISVRPTAKWEPGLSGGVRKKKPVPKNTPIIQVAMSPIEIR